MNWRGWLVRLGIFSFNLSMHGIIMIFGSMGLLYTGAYVIMGSAYLLVLLTDIPTWIKLYYMIGAMATVYRCCEIFPFLISYVVGFYIKCIALEPVVMFIADLFVCEYRKKFRAEIDTPYTRWGSISTPFYGTWMRRVCAVKICDTNAAGDSCNLENVSIVHMVEIRTWAYCLPWYELTIWAVSAINGRREKIHTAHMFNHFFRLIDPLQCFESDGLIAVVFANSETFGTSVLHLYDTRCNRSASYQCKQYWLTTDNVPIHYVAISCLARLTDQCGSISGWRIRLIHGDCDPEDPSKARLVNSILDLQLLAHGQLIRELISDHPTSQGIISQVISQEEITIDSWGWFSWSGGATCASDGCSIGISFPQPDDENTHVVLLYNLVSKTYLFTTSLDLMLRDKRFALATTPDDAFTMYPVVLNRRECIRFCRIDGQLYCAQFAVPNLKYLTSQALFHSSPKLGDLNQEQIRRWTGIGWLRDHLKRCKDVEGWPAVILFPETVRF